MLYTTSTFTFVIIPDMLDGLVLSNEDKLNLADELLTKLSNIEAKEVERETNENQRILDETARVSEFNDIKTEFNTLKTDIEDMQGSLTAILPINIPSCPSGETNRVLFSIPTVYQTGYQITINSLQLIPFGDIQGMVGVLTSTISIVEGIDTISETIFDTTNAFPTNGTVEELTIIDGLIDKSDDVHLIVTNDSPVITPEFSLQVGYNIEKVLENI